MKAKLGQYIIADSKRTLDVEGYRYFPRSAVRMDCLVAALKTAEDLRCPDGVQFYDVVVGNERRERAAWSYKSSRPEHNKAPIGQWVAFWGDVELVP